MSIRIVILVCFASLSSFGQSSTSTYISDSHSGCKIWAEYYSESVTVTWDGGCQDKLATGFGTLIWYYKEKETARYIGNMRRGNPNGKGKYVWSNGYVQQGNYYQGQFLNLDSTYLERVEGNVLPIVDKTNIYINDGESQTLFYYALVPKDRIKGALILLSGSSESANNVFTSNVELTQLACNSGFLVIVPSINNNLSVGVNELNFLNAAFDNAILRYNIPRDKFFIGGFSLGGLYALRYSEMANDVNYKTAVNPLAVFAADPPVDIARLYEIFQREIYKNISEAAVVECKNYIKSLEANFGGNPSNNPEKYKIFSAFSRSENDGGNLKYLQKTPVRIYSDPDIDWQMKKRKGDYFDMGALDQTTMINLLNRLGNSDAEFVNALGKGYNLDGTRNPHSWSIIDAKECVNWLMKYLN